MAKTHRDSSKVSQRHTGTGSVARRSRIGLATQDPAGVHRLGLQTRDGEEAPSEHIEPRCVQPADWSRFEDSMAEIFTTFGMNLGTPGTERTPARFLKALYDATSGYEGDHNLLTAFPTECRCDTDCLVSQIIEIGRAHV